MRNFLIGAAAALSLAAYAGPGSASDWKPAGPLNLQIGFGAGGTTDTIGRVVAKVMKEQTGWNVVAENKPGGGGVAMFSAIANRPADGTVVGLGVNMPVMINLVLRADQINFTLDSFDYLGTASRAQLALVAMKDAPFDDVAGLVEYAKKSGGAPLATDAKPQVLAMQKVMEQSGAEFQFLSAKSSAENIKMLLGGQAIAGFSAGNHIQYLETGEMKMIASMNNARHNYAPDTPTLPEQGFDIYVDPWYYFATTAGTPDDAREALTKAIAAALDSDEVKTVVGNALKSDIENVGPENTKQMLIDGIENVKVLFGK